MHTLRRLFRLRCLPGASLATIRFALACALLVAGTAWAQQEEPEWKKMPIVPIPEQPLVPLDPLKVELGRKLFQDVRLSARKDRSCAGCHPLERFGVEGLPRAVAYDDGKPRLRNTPTVFNASLSLYLNWNGRFNSLEELFAFIVEKDTLMANTWPNVVATLAADPQVLADFKKSYPDGGLSKATVIDALVNFERSLTTPNSRFDRYLRGQTAALTAREQVGFQLFKSYGCVSCHQGINIGGNLVQKFGVFEGGFARAPKMREPLPGDDPGWYDATRVDGDRQMFRVPSLRNVALTAPYFHGGQAATLDDAVRTMALVQLNRNLSDEEIRLLVEFLGTLTGEYLGKPLAPPAPATR